MAHQAGSLAHNTVTLLNCLADGSSCTHRAEANAAIGAINAASAALSNGRGGPGIPTPFPCQPGSGLGAAALFGGLFFLPGADEAAGLDLIAEGGTVARGGIGPVLQGAAGVDATAAEIEAAGGRILGREITVEAGGVRTRPDLFVELPSGEDAFIEVKTGPSARLTQNQSAAYPAIRSGGFTPYGQNAADAGLAPGRSYGPTPVIEVWR